MKERELENKKKRMPKVKYTVRFTEEEMKLLQAKAEHYNYRYLSDYIRDSGIYENVVQVDVKYTDELNLLFQEYIDEVKKLTKEMRRVLKWDTTMTEEEKETFQQSLYRVYSQLKSLKKSVNDNIDISMIEKGAKKTLYNKKLQELNSEADKVLKETKK